MSSPWGEVGDRVWVRRYRPLDQTIGVIGGDAGLVVIDTRASHVAADELRSELAQLPGSVVGVVNTHGHWDHVFGNARFREVSIWGHVRCAAMITEHGEDQRARIIEAYPADVVDQFREVELVPPSELFEESASLDLGDRQVDLHHLGRGHTDNDIVVRVSGADLLFAGDLLENAPAPGFGDSFPIAWAETGQRLLELCDGVVVPGHGDPFDRAFAERQVAELGVVADLVRSAVGGAIGTDEVMRRSPFPADATADALERARIELAE